MHKNKYVRVFEEILEKSNPWNQARAAWVSGKSGEVEAVDSLIRALETYEDEQLIESVAISLGELGDSKNLEPLVDALDHDDSNLQEWILWGIKEICKANEFSRLLDLIQENENIRTLQEKLYEAIDTSDFF